jgi:hypothetical protein
MAYSDEDKLDPSGERCWPFFKPGWSEDLHLSCNYVSHLLAAPRHAVEAVGRLRSGYDGSQDYDLALRLAERGRVVHVPRVLYHWRMVPGSVSTNRRAKTWAYDAARRALADALARRGEAGRIEDGPWIGGYRVRRPLERLDVSVVIEGPARPRRIRGAREVIVARDASPSALAAAAREVRGEVVLFLDGDLRLDREALEELAAQARRSDVACVTGKVVTADRRIESTGLALGLGPRGIAACPWRGRGEDDPGYFGLASVVRDVAAAPSACFAIERRKLEALGGVATDVASVHVGLDLSLRAAAAGLRTLFTPFALLRRRTVRGVRDLESGSSASIIRKKHGGLLSSDPHISPHFVRRRSRLELP